jgi:hypothetical protein
MTKYALEQARAQLQLCTFTSARVPMKRSTLPSNRISILGNPGPTWFIFLSPLTPIRHRDGCSSDINNKFTGFVQEVTPHEVSHQWWGHAVGWASYHDQWLSEGFAEFSAGLFLQQGVAGDWRKDYIEFWERLRQRLLEKNNFGVAPNDAGPLWMGLRLMSPRSMDAYQNVTYPKGAYVLQMLRSMMRGSEDHDQDKALHRHDA